MRKIPEPVVAPSGSDATTSGEVGSEGGSPGDLLRPPGRLDRADGARNRGGIPALIWIGLLVPVLVVLLWFATSLA